MTLPAALVCQQQWTAACCSSCPIYQHGSYQPRPPTACCACVIYEHGSRISCRSTLQHACCPCVIFQRNDEQSRQRYGYLGAPAAPAGGPSPSCRAFSGFNRYLQTTAAAAGCQNKVSNHARSNTQCTAHTMQPEPHAHSGGLLQLKTVPTSQHMLVSHHTCTQFATTAQAGLPTLPPFTAVTCDGNNYIRSSCSRNKPGT